MRMLRRTGGNARTRACALNFFPTMPPRNLITVPCCRACNQTASADQEYLRTALVLRMEFETHPESTHFIDAAMRSFDRHGLGGPTASIVQSTEPIELHSPAGVFLGEAGQFTPEVERMESACEWITQGLFFHETARRLAPGYDVRATVPGAIKVSRSDLVARLQWALDFALRE